ncbi:Microtubule-nucleating Tub4p (gamma-tubulin) complex component [Tilletia horrida]|uniref:Microtubule-nucleating Tub4p (Gamma-tubulin) complex component n=1 Tax=Tilletia horrida TaxID=155126 RepID=A0AAN6GT22_9BASI|nr:Microtubule-nucleating Tub4p (gamma-tubulin) complex component [Tilletia horrida]
MSSRRNATSSKGSQAVSNAALDLVEALLPPTDTRNVSAAAARRQQRIQAQAGEIVNDVLSSQLASRQASDSGFAEERLKRAVHRQSRLSTRPGERSGHTGRGGDANSDVNRLNDCITKLQSFDLPPRQLSAYLTLMEQLAFDTTGEIGSLPRLQNASQEKVADRPPKLAKPNFQSDNTPQATLPSVAHPDTAHLKPTPLASVAGKTKAQLLRQWKQSQGQAQVSETALLRDLIFLLQGISGKYVQFEELTLQQLQEEQRKAEVVANLAAGGYGGGIQAPEQPWGVVDDIEGNSVLRIRFLESSAAHISQPTRHLIHRIAELGRLYRRISKFATRTLAASDSSYANTPGTWGQSVPKGNTQTVGLIKQGLCHFIQKELTEYYRLIVVLEGQLQARTQQEEGADLDKEGSGLTLKRISAWTDDMLLRMRMMSAVIESCKDSHGGALVSVIHTYTFNGDPFIRKFTSRLLEEVSKPFLQTLSRWIHEGELHDPFQEFFVQLNADPLASGLGFETIGRESQPDVDAALLWQNKFSFREEMLPSFLGESFGRKIFSTGKSLNFIRHSCGGGEWFATRDQLGSDDAQGEKLAAVQRSGPILTFGASDDAGLRYTDIAGLEATINSAYSVVSQRLLSIFLDKYNLMGHLTALKDYLMLTKGDFVDLLMESIGPSLNRQASSLFRHNLTASLETAIRGSNAQHDNEDVLRRLDARILEFSSGDTGWDTFTLDYKVDSPVNTVLDGRAMTGYQVVFNHLWKIKRVELALGSCWSRLAAAKAGHDRAFGRRKDGSALEAEKGVMKTLQRLSEMTHFIRQLQAYNQLEVIEYSWHDLQAFFAKRQGDLDELIEAHRAFLDALIGKMLMKGGRRTSASSLIDDVRTNLDTVLAYCSAIDDLAHFINGEAAKAQIRGADLGAPKATERVTLPAIMSRVSQHSATFQERTQHIIAALEKHSNLVVRDLGSRLNFNSYYERKAGHQGKDKE